MAVEIGFRFQICISTVSGFMGISIVRHRHLLETVVYFTFGIGNRCISASQLRNMKLLTHNMLTSKCIKGVKEGYPLRLKVENYEVKETDFNEDFLVRLLPKIRYEAVYQAAQDVGLAETLPAELPENAASAEDFLKKLHHILLEVEIQKGELLCPETGRVFPISNGIPNMLLKPEEVG